uniref:Uncharacterized protein n=1 Tax=Amphimedon queenslandica TaxID=400682 RepID=A0A1X7VAF4_AMPQE
HVCHIHNLYRYRSDLKMTLKDEGDVPLCEHLYLVGVCCTMELQEIQKFHVIARVFTLLAFDVFLLLFFTGIDSWKGFDDSAILLLDIGMKMESK